MGKILKWPILYIAVQFGMIFLCAFLFIGLGYNANDFAFFLAKYKIIIALLLGIIFIPLLIHAYHKEKVATKPLQLKDIFLFFLVGVSLSILFNTFVYYLDRVFDFTNLYGKNTQFFTNLISVGMIGPILEEYMFRGVVYHECKKQYSNMKSILICTILFTLLHFTFVQMIYAFAFSFILIYVYERYQNIKAPIILHMASNITTMIWTIILIQNHFVFNYIIYLFALIILIIIFVRLKKMWYNSGR